MSVDKETYCRLCAEPTSMEQLISINDDVGLNSKITAKMKWINIDVTGSEILPKTICFSCFDLLERTWIFLHNVRNAQTKLNEIFHPEPEPSDSKSDIGKPVNENWENFTKTKKEIKEETPGTIRSESSLTRQSPPIDIKEEPCEEMAFFDYIPSSDSDLPLKLAAGKKKKLKTKKKRKKHKENEIFSNVEALQLPILDMPLRSMTWDDFTWCCSNCDAQCKSLDLLRLHSIENHSRCSTFKCSDCHRTITNYKSFILHVRKHYQNLRSFCEYCNKYFESSYHLKKHMTEHYNGITCQLCGTSFADQSTLNNHISSYGKVVRKKTNIKNEELNCNHCDRKFKSKSNLKTHLMMHADRSRDFSCHVCGRMFYTKGALITHMATHEDNKPFKCEYCPLAFRARGNLNAHKTLHSGVKPFVCEQCGKSFRVKKHLKSHSIVHTDLMPYPCPYCAKTFRFKTRLNLHVRQHTGAKPYNCVYCHRDFTNGSNYKKHMKRRHNVDTSVRIKLNTNPMNEDGEQKVKVNDS